MPKCNICGKDYNDSEVILISVKNNYNICLCIECFKECYNNPLCYLIRQALPETIKSFIDKILE